MNPDPTATPDISTPAEELIALCDRLCDGSLTVSERERIEALVLGDAALRRLYVEQMQLHAQLTQNSSRLSDAPLQTVLRPVSSAPIHPPRWRFSAQLWNAAAALMLLIGGAWWLATSGSDNSGSDDSGSDEIAQLQDVQNARWRSSTLPTAPGSTLTAGRLYLAEGLARLRFASGAEVTLEGPADIELISRQRCRLHSGSLVAHVPDSAKGFTVLTKQATLIDHGTDFGISTDSDGRARVHVMKGEVELQHRTGGPALRLLTQQMATITPEGLMPVSDLDIEPGNQRGPTTATAFTQELTTTSGRGAASYVTSPGTEKHFSDTLLLLKNAAIKNFLRKAILRFDLAAITNPHQLQAARLTLQFEPTGYGFATLGGDARFGVYAVTDDAQDTWSPTQLDWHTMPAFHDDPGRVDERTAVKVGEFVMPLGVLSGPMSIESPALIERIRSDPNRQLTLIIVRENPLAVSSGIVHGFAGNHHPTLPPPTLRLR
ncbi:MAG: FecR domain-containing protein [Planctomycetes bacterium]|nr:FecR domain-containing protein [Planctomycetota bacterium]